MIASVSLAALVASFALVAPAQAGTFSDVPADHYAYNSVESLTAMGVFDKNSAFFPGRDLNRAEAVKIILQSIGADVTTPSANPFPDVAKGEWYAPYVKSAVDLGIVSGYPDGTFKPNGKLNRAEIAKMLVKAFAFDENMVGSPFVDVKAGDWFRTYVLTLYNNGVVSGKKSGYFAPADNVNRGEVAVMLYRAMNPAPMVSSTPAVSSTPVVSGSPAPASATPTAPSKAGLTVALSAGSAASSTVPKGANGVPLITVDLTAGAEDNVTVDMLTFKRNGVGSPSDFDNVYVYEGNIRKTSGRTVTTDAHTVEFTNLGFVVQKGQTRTFTVRGDIAAAATAGNESYFSLDAAKWVGSNAAAVNGSFPVMGKAQKIGGASSGTLTISKSGTPATPKIGESQAEIAKFKLDASGEDIALQTIALLQNGTINRSDVTNLKLYQGTTLLAEVKNIDGDDLMQFDLGTKPYIIKDGNSKVFSVKADLKGKAAETTSVYIEEDADILAIGQKYGFGVNVTRTSYNGGSASTRTDLTLEGGQVTLAYSGPSATNYSSDSKDQPFLKINLSADRNIDVKKLSVVVESLSGGTSGGDAAADAGDLYNTTNSEANIKDIRVAEILGDGSIKTLMGPKELKAVSGSSSDDVTQTLNFTDSFPVKAGETKKLAITADIDNDATAGDKFRFTLSAVSTAEGIKDVDTNKFVTDIVPTAAIQGSTITVQSASVTVTLSSNPSSQTIVRGSSAVPVVGFNFKAGQSDDITLTDLTVVAVINNSEAEPSISWASGTEIEGAATSVGSNSTASAANIVQNVALYDGTTMVSKLESPNTSTGSITFSGITWKIPKGETKTLTLKTDLSKNARAGSYNDQISFIIAGASAVTAEDGEGDSVSATVSANGVNTKSGTYTTASPDVFLTVAQTGTLTVSAPASQVEDQTVVAGRNEVKLARFKVKALEENFTVKKLTLDVVGTTATRTLKNLMIKYPTKANEATVRDGNSTVSVGASTASSIEVTFDGLNFAVGKDNDNVEFEVFGNFQDIQAGSTSGPQTGDTVQITVAAVTSDQDKFEATGDGSGDVVSTNAAVSGTGTVTLRDSVPTITYVGTKKDIQYSSEADILDFKVTADSSGNVDYYQIEFLVSANGVDTTTLTGASGWKLFKTSNLNTALDTATAASISGTSYRVTFTLSTPQTVSSSGETYRVRGPIAQDTGTGADATDAVINIKVAQDETAATTAAASTVAALAETANNFVWSDRSKASHSVSTLDWANGYKLSVPTEFFTVR